MSLWLDFFGTEVRFVATPTYGRIRIAEAGRGNRETLLFQHGLNGHPEAFAKNQRHDEFLIPLESLRCETLFLWTQDNPIHDLEAARAAQALVPGSVFYLMQADAAHWPQYEAPDEFNAVAASFFSTGKLPATTKA